MPGMAVIPGLLLSAGGLFLHLWYRTVVSLPVRRRPAFVQAPLFKWGVPATSLALCAAGMVLLGRQSIAAALLAAAACAFLGWAVIRFDRYSAEMRMIHAHYRRMMETNPGMGHTEALYHTVRWRYPDWSDDRIVELAAGKDIEGLILLIVVQDYQVHPISDWELYRAIKDRATRVAAAGN